MLSNGNSLLDEEIEVLWDFSGTTILLQNSENLFACNVA